MKTQLTAAQLRGIYTAIPTPVTADDRIDEAAAQTLVSHLVRQGVDGIVPLGGTGEYGALAREERTRMAALTAQTVDGRIPVIAGVLDTGLHDALSSGKALANAGADAVMVLTPYYTTPTQRGIRDYFLRYADASPVPVVIYEIPYRTRVTVAPEVLHELSRHENIIGMKACNTDMYHFLKVVAGVSDTFAVLSGEDTLFPVQMASGAKGGIIVTATVLPRTWRALHALCAAGRIPEALAMHRELMPLLDLAFAETNPGPLKSAWDLIGIHAPHVLAPLVPAAEELTRRLRAELAIRLRAEAAFD